MFRKKEDDYYIELEVVESDVTVVKPKKVRKE